MKELGRSDRDVDNISKSEVSYGTVNRVKNNKNKDVELGSLRGIAIGIEVPVEYLVALALDQDPQERNLLSSEEQDLINYFRRLPFDKQTFILDTVKSLCGQQSTAIEAMIAPVNHHK